MKKRITFDYDEENGLMIAQLRVGGKTYFGTAAKNPGDDDPFPPSYSIGEKIAEARAYKSMYSDKIAEKKLELKGVKRVFCAMPPGTKNRNYVEHLYLAIIDEIKELEDLKRRCDKSISTAIESRGIYVRSRLMKKEQRKEVLKELGKAIKVLGQDKKD